MTQALLVQKLHPQARMPERAHDTDAGYDLAAVGAHTIAPGSWATIPTGLAMTVPLGTYGRIAPRSGLAAKTGIDVLAGVIDRGYTAEVKVVLMNHATTPFTISPGHKIAQLVLECIQTPPVQEVAALDSSARGAGGFGSTGQ